MVQNFEDFVFGYFRERGKSILLACKAYIEGMRVGSMIEDNGLEIERAGPKHPSPFQTHLNRLFEELLMEFTVKGADCLLFLSGKVNPERSKSMDNEESDLRHYL